MGLLPACVIGLLLVLGTPSSAVAQTITSDPTGTVFCSGSEVIFTCTTRGADALSWGGDDFYVGRLPAFSASLHPVNFTRTTSSNPNTLATLTQNYLDGGVPVLVSTLRIMPLSLASSGFVNCIHDGNTNQTIDFQVVGLPVVPQDVVTFQFEQVKGICAIASVLQSPINAAKADVINYTVSVDEKSVPHDYTMINSTDGIMHFTLLYNSTCTDHSISIAANNMCGQSPGTDEIVLDPRQRLMLNVPVPGGSSNIECSVMTVIMSVVLVAFKYLLDLC